LERVRLEEKGRDDGEGERPWSGVCVGLRKEDDGGTGWRGRRKMKACAGKGVRLVFGKERGSGRLWEMTGCGLKGKCWPCLGREDGEALVLAEKIQQGGRRLLPKMEKKVMVLGLGFFCIFLLMLSKLPPV